MEANVMRISLRWALAGMMPALVCASGVAGAQNFLNPSSPSNSVGQASYYAGTDIEQYFTAADDKAPAPPATESMGTCNSCNSSNVCCDPVGNWRDNTLVWFGADAFKSIGDSAQPPGPGAGFMNSAGVVGGFNTGFALGDSRVRGQIGATYGVYDLKGRDTVSPSSSEQQTFITAGFFKRSDVCCGDRISWGLVYDQFFGHQWGLLASEVYLSQVRGIVGYALSEWNEVGVWGTWHTNSDHSVTGFNGAGIRAMNQFNAYWRHNYDFGASTMAYVGGVDSADLGSWQVGVLGQAPMSDTLALYTNVTFAFPGSKTGAVGSNELEWNIGGGLAYYFGGKAVSPTVSGQKGLPLLPVANNGSLLITN
jgi:hypothetical protein